MATIRVSVNKRGPIHLFQAVYVGRYQTDIDNLNRSVAARLTKQAKDNLEATRIRESEKGNRPSHRLTGALQGHSGRKASIVGNVLGATPKGLKGPRQGKGVGWPRIDILERRARHWRALEFGTPFVTMPRGLFINQGSPVSPANRTESDTFITYSEFIASRGLRGGPTRGRAFQTRRAAARRRAVKGTKADRPGYLVGRSRRGEGIEAKHFLENAWNEIVGSDGSKAFEEMVKITDEAFRQFRAK